MSKLLIDSVEFSEAIYASYDTDNLRKLDEKFVNSKSERDKFLKRAMRDSEYAGGITVKIIRVDKSGVHEIHPEEKQ